MISFLLVFVFFFQAEDGIRDGHVTGVQTCALPIYFRFSTEVTEPQLRQRTEEILHRHGLDFDVMWQLSGQPFLTAAGELVAAVVQAVKDETVQVPLLSTAGGTSDARFIAPTGAQGVDLGPLTATIHQVNERVCAQDLNKLTRIYQKTIERLLLNDPVQ